MQLTLNESLNPATVLEDLKDVNAALVEALDHLLDDVECHCDGDDRSMTLDITAEQARAALKLAKGE